MLDSNKMLTTKKAAQHLGCLDDIIDMIVTVVTDGTAATIASRNNHDGAFLRFAHPGLHAKYFLFERAKSKIVSLFDP